MNTSIHYREAINHLDVVIINIFYYLGDENPPIGVFWDIENCAVPRGKSALAVVQRIRECFFTGHREAEFMCVCDINKESSIIIQELNDAQVCHGWQFPEEVKSLSSGKSKSFFMENVSCSLESK